MSKQYQWKTDAVLISGGYPGEETGILTGSTAWVTTDVMTGTASAEYFFRDSASMSNANSSRVVVGIEDSWTATIDSRNNLSVTVTTRVTSIKRDGVQGSPAYGGSPYRDMFIRREAGGAILWQIQNDDISNAHSILSTPLTLQQYTFTLAPGEMASRGSIHFRSNVDGHDTTPTPSAYVDEMWLGANFRNILPKDYRPGERRINGTWMSHNRDGGVCDRHGFGEMRTNDGGVGTDNPPSRKQGGRWLNQMLIGKE